MGIIMLVVPVTTITIILVLHVAVVRVAVNSAVAVAVAARKKNSDVNLSHNYLLGSHFQIIFSKSVMVHLSSSCFIIYDLEFLAYSAYDIL